MNIYPSFRFHGLFQAVYVTVTSRQFHVVRVLMQKGFQKFITIEYEQIWTTCYYCGAKVRLLCIIRWALFEKISIRFVNASFSKRERSISYRFCSLSNPLVCLNTVLSFNAFMNKYLECHCSTDKWHYQWSMTNAECFKRSKPLRAIISVLGTMRHCILALSLI